MDPLDAAIRLAFLGLFAISIWRYAKHRGPLELAVAAVFGTYAALFALSFINQLDASLAPVARPLLIALLFAQPIVILRLIDQIQPVSRRATWIMLGGGVLSWLIVTVLPGQPLVSLIAVTYFFGGQAWCAGRFVIVANRRYGLARARLILAAVGTILFGASILLLGVASAASSGAATPVGISQASRIGALLAGVVYLVAFLPPVWLRRFIYRAAAFSLVGNLVTPPTDRDARGLWLDLAETAREVLGARRVTVLPSGGGPPSIIAGDREGTPAARSSERHEDEPPTSSLTIDINVDGEPRERLVAEIEGRPLFAEDDVALIEHLGRLTARSVDREIVLLGLGDAQRALAESEAIKASEARFRALLEAEPNAVLALDDTGRVTWATRQAGDLFGSASDALIGVPLGDLVVLHQDTSQPVAGSEPRVVRAETTGRRTDGTRFPAEMALTEFELDGRAFQLAVISDVAWRHEEDQIRERFLGVLSHELRTPVTSIYGGTQLLLRRGARLDPATRNELLSSVAAESERLQRMIENLVALARIERGSDYGGPRPVLLDRMIKQLVERERPLWPEVTIKLAIAGPVHMVAADEEYLGQIMRNLLSNAAKYGGDGATVEVTVADGEDEVLVLVRDSGPGIAEDEAEKLFGLYFRGARQASVAPGAGIGLFVCRELVATMGGRIWAKQRAEGGAEFGFSLPAYPDEVEPVPDSPARPTVAAAQPTPATTGQSTADPVAEQPRATASA